MQGSAEIHLKITDTTFCIRAPFLRIGDKTNRVALLRRVAEVNFSPLRLEQIHLKKDELHFEYEMPIELAQPNKVYDIIRNVALFADKYDDEFVENFHQGSALVRIFTTNNNNYLFATSPLNQLPKGNLNELLTYVNSNPVPPYQLAIYKNKIFISYRTHLSDIYSGRKDEIKKYVKELVLKADELDDFFRDKFGCEMSLESKNLEENPVQVIQTSTLANEETKNVSDTENRQADNIVDKLKKLKELYNMELITEAEYYEKKMKMLESL